MGTPVRQHRSYESIAWIPEKTWPSYFFQRPGEIQVDAVLKSDVPPEIRVRGLAWLYSDGLYIADDRPDLIEQLRGVMNVIPFSTTNPSATAHDLAKKHYEAIKKYLEPGSDCRIVATYPFWSTTGVYQYSGQGEG